MKLGLFSINMGVSTTPGGIAATARAAEAAMNRVPPSASPYQDSVRSLLGTTLSGYDAEDASVAVQYTDRVYSQLARQ